MRNLFGYPIIVTEILPKVEGSRLVHTRSFLTKMFSGKMNDIEITEEDAIWLLSHRSIWDDMYPNESNTIIRETKTILMNHSLFNKLKEVLDE